MTAIKVMENRAKSRKLLLAQRINQTDCILRDAARYLEIEDVSELNNAMVVWKARSQALEEAWACLREAEGALYEVQRLTGESE